MSAEQQAADKRQKFGAIFREYGQALQSYLRRKVRSRETAEDLMQETFARVYAAGNDELASPRNFLFRTAHNLAVNYQRDIRNARTDAVADVEALGIVHDSALPEDALRWREELALLERVIGSLPPQCRQVFILQKLELRSHQEIADELGIAVSTVEKHIAKAVKLCYQHYRQSQEENGRGR